MRTFVLSRGAPYDAPPVGALAVLKYGRREEVRS
jgi:hypothetical protein